MDYELSLLPKVVPCIFFIVSFLSKTEKSPPINFNTLKL